MDAFLVDEIVVPPEEKTAYQESIRYLPNLFSADFPYRFPDTTSLPALQNGYLTFGVFTRLNKTSSLTFELWAALLKALPTSQLLFKAPELDAPGVRSHVEQTFVSLGVAPERLTLMGSSSWAEHMATMLQADIALDPFPHGGGVTTMEMLNLGIPVLTLVHPTIAGRLSATLLNSLGLNDWVTTSPEEYLQHALRLDKDKEGLATLRRSLRERFSKSVLADHAGYLRAVEHEYRALWRDWCTSQKAL
jgi:predicted O-linked N-acetylglucosamine transferase (SPINDLY family)